MALSLGEIVATLRLRDELTPALKVASRNLQQTGDSLQRVGSQIQSAGSAILPFSAAVAGAGVAAFTFGKDFEAAMTRVGNLTDVGIENIGEMRASIERMAPAVGIGPTPLAEALLVVASTGLKGATALEVLESSARASASGLGETKDIARAVTAAMTAYGVENLSAAQASDKLFAAVRAGGAEATEFAGTLGRVVGIASQVGVSFDEVLASVATFTRLGVNAEEAVTALRGTMATLLKPSKDATDQLAAMGLSIDEVRKSVRERGLMTTLTELVSVTKGNDDALAAIVPNIRALAGILGTAGAQADAYKQNLTAIQRATGDVDRAFAAVAKTIDFQWNSALAEARELAIRVFDAFRGQFAGIVDGFHAGARAMSGMVDLLVSLPDGAKTAVASLVALSALAGPGLIALGATIRVVAFSLSGLAIGLKVLSGTALPALLSPLGLAVIAIGGLVLAVLKFRTELKKLEDRQSKSGQVIDGLTDALGNEVLTIDRANRKLQEMNTASGQATISGLGLGRQLTIVTAGAQDAASVVTTLTNRSRGLTEEVKKLVTTIAGSPADLADLTAAWRALTPAQRDNLVIAQNVVDAYENIRDLVDPSALPADLETLRRRVLFVSGAQDRMRASAEQSADALNAVARSLEGQPEILRNMAVQMDDVQLATGKFVEQAHLTIPNLQDMNARMAEAKKNALTLAGSLRTVLGGALSDLNSIFEAAFTGGGGLGGAIKAFSTTITKGVLDLIRGVNPILGKFSGAIVGGLGKLFGGLFGGQDRAATKEIRKLQEELLKTHGSLVNISQLSQALGVNLAQAFGNTGRKGLEQFKAVTAAFQQQLKAVTAEMDAIAASSGLASQGLRQFIQTMGDAPQVAAFVKGQALSAIQGLQTFLGKATIGSQQTATSVAGAISATFRLLIEQGLPITQVFEKLTPIINQFSAQLTKTGLDGGAAFRNIQALADLAADQIAGPAIEAVNGLNQTMQGLHNAGLLNQEIFVGLAAQIGRTFQSLVDQGFDGNQAMLLMQPTLQTIWELQQRFGFQVDDTTQKLIHQATEAGIVGEQQKDIQEQILDVLLAIGQALGADLPRAAANAQSALQTLGSSGTAAMDRLGEAIDAVNFGGSPGGLKEIPILAAQAAETMSSEFAQAFQGVTRDAFSAFGGITGQLDRLSRGITIPVDVRSSGVPEVPVHEMADGGVGIVTQPTLFLAGESGPERFAFGSATTDDGGGTDQIVAMLESLTDEIANQRRDQRRALQLAIADAVALARSRR